MLTITETALTSLCTELKNWRRNKQAKLLRSIILRESTRIYNTALSLSYAREEDYMQKPRNTQLQQRRTLDAYKHLR